MLPRRPRWPALVLLLVLLVAAPVAGQGGTWVNRPPQVEPIRGALHPPTTTYTTNAVDPDGDTNLFYEWKNTNTCGSWTPAGDHVDWNHGDDTDCHVRTGPGAHPGIVSLRVFDSFGAVTTCTYVHGSVDGVGGACSSARGACEGDLAVTILLAGNAFEGNVTSPEAAAAHRRAVGKVTGLPPMVSTPIPAGAAVTSPTGAPPPTVCAAPLGTAALSGNATTWPVGGLHREQGWDLQFHLGIGGGANDTVLRPGDPFRRFIVPPGSQNATLNGAFGTFGGAATGPCRGYGYNDAEVIYPHTSGFLGASSRPAVQLRGPAGITGCPAALHVPPNAADEVRVTFQGLDGTLEFLLDAWDDEDGDLFFDPTETGLRGTELRLTSGTGTTQRVVTQRVVDQPWDDPRNHTQPTTLAPLPPPTPPPASQAKPAAPATIPGPDPALGLLVVAAAGLAWRRRTG